MDFQRENESRRSDRSLDWTESDLQKMLKQLKNLEKEKKDILGELEEQKIINHQLMVDKKEYHEKYINSLILIEEQKQRLDKYNERNVRANEQINVGIKLANDKFNEEIQELRNLPFILEAKQIELQQKQQKLKLSEKTVNSLSLDLEGCIVKYELLSKELEEEKKNNQDLLKKITLLQNSSVSLTNQVLQLQNENELLNNKCGRIALLQEAYDSKQMELENQKHQMEILKEENSRHINRMKERTETEHRNTNVQIAALEKETVQLRASFNTVIKERDEIRYRMQIDLSNLSRKFSEAKQKIESLKGHVNILRTSCSNMFEGAEETDEEEDQIKKEDEQAKQIIYAKNRIQNESIEIEKVTDNKIESKAISTADRSTCTEINNNENELLLQKLSHQLFIQGEIIRCTSKINEEKKKISNILVNKKLTEGNLNEED